MKNTFELKLYEETEVEEIEEEDEASKRLNTFNFVKIKEIDLIPAKKVIDTFGIIKVISDDIEVTVTGNKVTKRHVTISDENNKTIDLVFWGESAKNFNEEIDSIITVKGGKINDYRGVKSLSIILNSQILINDFENEEIKNFQLKLST
ncbi:replication protein A 70 kDa DNA-binding subunit-like [Leptopilina heterotoma]|uniref:replication protein A 70 kDa DNA-binding subunit-like n=1 Tax=Leptopilina heterotoma TaxID=63436 RepID=UPI001CA90224|nr:replication protein A 70 kDa DNA-binding subunit-like [Leptopilina heterotoma]